MERKEEKTKIGGKDVDNPKNSKGKYIGLFLLLAIVCIGAVELAVCSVKEPEIYQQITAPVRSAAQAAAEAGRQMWRTTTRTVQAAWEDTTETVERVWMTAEQTAAAAAEQVALMLNPPEPEPEPEPEPVQLEEEQLLSDESELDPIPDTARRLTCLVERDGVEYLTGGNWEIIYYNQTEAPWKEELYGRDPIGGYGCGPTTMAMAVSSMTGEKLDPAQMAKLCVKQGHWASRQGSYLSIVEEIAQTYGLQCESVDVSTADAQLLTQRLAGGEMAVALMGNGHFTKRGHFILLRGVTLDGKILVADPASRERTLVTWEPELILEELSKSRHNGAPLWLLCPEHIPELGED